MEQIKVRTELIPAYAVVHLSGFLNTFAEATVEAEIGKLLEMRCPVVLLRFAEVEHINSAGITILIGVAMRIKEAGGKLGAYDLSEHYRKIFHMVGLDEYILMGEDRESLLGQLRSLE